VHSLARTAIKQNKLCIVLQLFHVIAHVPAPLAETYFFTHEVVVGENGDVTGSSIDVHDGRDDADRCSGGAAR